MDAGGSDQREGRPEGPRGRHLRDHGPLHSERTQSALRMIPARLQSRSNHERPRPGGRVKLARYAEMNALTKRAPASAIPGIHMSGAALRWAGVDTRPYVLCGGN